MTIDALLATTSSLLASSAIALLLAFFFKTARSTGMDGDLDGTIIRFHVDAMAIALTDLYYGGKGDYSGLIAVQDLLSQRIFRESEPSAKRDAAAIDRALRDASQLDWNTALASGRFVLGLEPGYVDLVRLAFLLFGLRIASIFKLYCAMLGLSLTLLAIAFWQMSGVLWSLAALMLAFHFVAFGTGILDFQARSITNKRLAAILAVLPALHIMLIMATGQEATAVQIALAVAQGLMFAWVLWMRNSTGWLVMAALALALVLLGLGLAIDAAFLRGLWAFALLMGLSDLMTAHRHAKVHPVHHSRDLSMAYPKWHSAYVGFGEDAATFAKNLLPFQKPQLLDLNACIAVARVLRTSPTFAHDGPASHVIGLRPPFISFNLSAFFGMKWTVYERAAKIAFFEYFWKNLSTMPKLYFYLKPRSLLRNLALVMAPLPVYLKAHPLLALSFLLMALPAGYHFAQAPSAAQPIGFAAFCLLAGAPIPLLWAFSFRPAGYSMAEIAWMLLFALWTTFAFLMASALPI